MPSKPQIVLSKVHKTYFADGVSIPVLSGIDLEVQHGELVVLMGPSGSGKTTLLNLIAGIDTPTGGSIKVGGKELTAYGRKQLTTYRKDTIGYVFQFYNLIPTLTALENVELALQIKGDRDLKKAGQWLERLGLGDKFDRFPSQLSGGEQQRVAIARAMVKSPAIVIGDEPTGNLDEKNSKDILKIIRSMNKETGTTFVLATHDKNYEKIATKVMRLRSGKLVGP